MTAALLLALALGAAVPSLAEPDPMDELIALAQEPQPAVRLATSLGAVDPPSESDSRAMRLLTLGIGPTQLRHTAVDGERTWGGAIAGAIAVDASGGRSGMLNLYRLHFGVDQTGAKSFNLDLNIGYALHLGRLSIGALGGAGVDWADKSAEDETPNPGQLVLPVAPYLEYGGRVAYAFDVLPITVDVIYSKVFRTADRAPVEKHGDVRLLFGLLSLTARYTEFVAERDPVFQMFTSKGRSAQMFWIMAGVGF